MGRYQTRGEKRIGEKEKEGGTVKGNREKKKRGIDTPKKRKIEKQRERRIEEENGHDGEERGTSLMWPCASSTILISANRYLLGSTGLRDWMDILFRLSACFSLPLSLFMK